MARSIRTQLLTNTPATEQSSAAAVEPPSISKHTAMKGAWTAALEMCIAPPIPRLRRKQTENTSHRLANVRFSPHEPCD
jgi:hypothetical protein